MSQYDEHSEDSPAHEVIARFIQAYPDDEEADFDAWADGQPDLVEGSSFRAVAKQALEEWRDAARLLALGFASDDGGSVFRGRRVWSDAEGGPTGSPEALHPGRKIGSFTLTQFIARGGMGQVWEAYDEQLRRKVALKLVLPDRIDERSLQLFAREARAGGRLHHPNLVTTLGYGTDDGLSWIAQELVPGSWTLKNSLDELRAGDSVPKSYYREVPELIAKVADGLQAAHDAGVIHRDIKPQNILIAVDGTPKVTDFGLARVSDDSVFSQTGEIGGTWAYMSPEQVKAKRMLLDHRTDVFSLGVVFYELLALRRPFEGDTAHQIAQEIIHGDPPEASKVRSQCPRELAVIVGKALEKVPSNRYRSMAGFAADLRRHLTGEPILAKPPGAIVRGVKWVRRNPAKSTAGAVTMVAFVVITLLLSKYMGVARAEKQRADEVLSLSAIQDYDDLVFEADELWPPHPELIDAYKRWLEDAQELVGELPNFRKKREQLRALALPEKMQGRIERGGVPTGLKRKEGPSRRSGFPPEADSARWWHANLTKLINALEGLSNPRTGLLASSADAVSPDHGWSVRRRLEFAQSIEERSVTGPHVGKRWAVTISAIEASPLYGRLKISPQMGLVPIGRDPSSGFWEFAHLGTGVAPTRDEFHQIERSEAMGLVLVLIPGGRFRMGAQRGSRDEPNFDASARENESPVHEVTLSPYFISKYEMTQAQWLRLTGNNPSGYQKDRLAPTLLHPIEQVSWQDGMKWLPRVGLTIPTEAQWEYAARGGTDWPRWIGESDEALMSGDVNIADRAYAQAQATLAAAQMPTLDDGTAAHGEVGHKPANGFGLHEVLGNVWEWVRDGYGPYSAEPQVDPLIPWSEAGGRINRGGAFTDSAANARSARRYEDAPHYFTDSLGLRPARDLEQ